MVHPFFEDENKRNLVIALVTGFLFATGWWILIDIVATYPKLMSKNKTYFLPGIGGTIAMIIVLITPYRTAQDAYMFSNNKCPNALTITVLFFALVFSFGAFIWAIYIWIADFLLEPMPAWPGVGILLQSSLILASNLILKFGRILHEEY